MGRTIKNIILYNLKIIRTSLQNIQDTPCFIMQQLDFSIFFIPVSVIVVNYKVYSVLSSLSLSLPPTAKPSSVQVRTCFHAAGVAGSNRCFQDWILNYIFGKFLKLVEKYNKMCIVFSSHTKPCIYLLSLAVSLYNLSVLVPNVVFTSFLKT